MILYDAEFVLWVVTVETGSESSPLEKTYRVFGTLYDAPDIIRDIEEMLDDAKDSPRVVGICKYQNQRIAYLSDTALDLLKQLEPSED